MMIKCRKYTYELVKSMMFVGVFALLASCLNTVDQPVEEGNVSESKKSEMKYISEVKTFKDSLGWGFDVYLDGKISIHQPIIPAIYGNKGFANEEDALKIAKLMMSKIENRIMPPSISVHELDSMKIKY